MLYRNTKEILKEILYHPEQYREFGAMNSLTEKQLAYVVRYRFGTSYLIGRTVAHILMHEDPVEFINRPGFRLKHKDDPTMNVLLLRTDNKETVHE